MCYAVHMPNFCQTLPPSKIGFKPTPKLGYWWLPGVIRPQGFHFWWRKSSYFMHSRDKCNQRRAGQNTRTGLYVMNFTHVMHINRMHFLCWIQNFIFQGHLRSYKGHQKVKSGKLTIIPELYIYFDAKFDGEAKSGVKLNRFRCWEVIWGHSKVK